MPGIGELRKENSIRKWEERYSENVWTGGCSEA